MLNNDESIISIPAAFACLYTKNLDLEGGFDLAEDVVSGEFILKKGNLVLNGKSGLGIGKMNS